MSVAILSPHLDDAVLSAWTVLRRPGPVTVVNVFAGVPPAGEPPPWDVLTGARDAAERVRERRDEDRAALAHAGREAIDLDFLDSQYRAGPVDADALRAALAQAVAGADELWAPAAIGARPDHVQVRELALALGAGGGATVRLYAELPYAARWGWPRWVSGRRPRTRLNVDDWLAAYLPDGTAATGERHALSRAETRRKRRALREYATQWAALEAWIHTESRRALRFEASFAAPARDAPAAPQ